MNRPAGRLRYEDHILAGVEASPDFLAGRAHRETVGKRLVQP